MIDILFRNKVLYKADIQHLSQTKTDGKPGPKVWTSKKIVDCIFYKGGAAQRFIGDAIKADISAVALANPRDLSLSDVPDDSRVVVRDGSGSVLGTFSVVNADDIAGQGKVIMIPMKEFK